MTTHTKTTKTATAHADTTSTPTETTTTPASVTSTPKATGSLAAPPTNAVIPDVPKGFVPTDGANYRGNEPRKAELVALPLAIRDLQAFATYSQALGATAPPVDEVLPTFNVANLWSTMRAATSAWDAYCRDQEGISWTAARALMDRLRPAFDLAATANPSLTTTYAGIATLLGARTMSARRAVATRRRNKQEVAAGKTPSHGAVGKSAQKAAAKAALAAQNAKGAEGASPVVAEAPVATTTANGNGVTPH